MQMDGWEDYLHVSLRGEHVLFAGLRLDTPASFIVATFVSVLVCITERCVYNALFSRDDRALEDNLYVADC